jgi:hypothetical protein
LQQSCHEFGSLAPSFASATCTFRLASRWPVFGRSCQREGAPVEEIRPGDRVFFEPGENHWHGAAPNRFMVHIAMQQSDDSGSPVTWGEHVTDEQYAAGRSV